MKLNHKIGLGTAQFGMNYGVSNLLGQTSENEVARILDSAYEMGIKLIDTASAYGNAQSILGKNKMQRFKVMSKFMSFSDKGSVTAQLEECLEQLQINQLYAYLAHRPAELLKEIHTWEELLKIREDGKIEKIGFSLNSPKELEDLLINGFEPDVIQVPFNYFDNRFYDHIIRLKSKGCEIHCRSVFLQGLFFLSPAELPIFFDSVKRPIRDLQKKFGDNLANVLLKYVASQEFIDFVMIGVENEFQLKKNLIDLDATPEISTCQLTIPESVLMPFAWPKEV